MPPDWWDESWKRRTPISFDNSAQAEALPGFVVLVRFDSTSIDYAQVQDQGQDLRFVDGDGTELDHEIELWDELGSSYVWVIVKEIDASVNTDFIWAYYGNSGAADGQDPAAVWNEYEAVWHLNETVDDEQSTASHVDATGNGNSGSQNGNDDVVVAGSIGRAQTFDGTDDHIAVDTSGLQLTGQAMSVLARAYITNTSLHAHVLGVGSTGRYHQLWRDSAAPGWAGRFNIDGASEDVLSSLDATGDWVTLAVVYDGADVRLYVNGALTGTPDTATGNLTAWDSPLHIGNNPNLSPRELEGHIDEVRIVATARSGGVAGRAAPQPDRRLRHLRDRRVHPLISPSASRSIGIAGKTSMEA